MANYRVSELVNKIANYFIGNQEYNDIVVLGEITNYTHAKSGHLYFSLKDEKASISCAMFASSASKLTFKVENGLKVLLKGKVNVYPTTGSLQFVASDMKQQGIGDLYQQYVQLKNKLNNEGLFDPKYKKEIDRYPTKVVLICGKDSAALADLQSNIARRWPVCEVKVLTSLVQGNGASVDIINNLLIADNLQATTIILARGGGSFEDLNCFNDEQLVRTIFNLKTPIICGVGHESDFTLVDFVCDLRAPTPTAAIELATVDYLDVLDTLSKYQSILNKIIENELLIHNQTLDNYQIALDRFKESFAVYRNKITKLELNLTIYGKKIINYYDGKLVNYQNILNTNINALLVNNKHQLFDYKQQMQQYIHNYLNVSDKRLQSCLHLLDAYNPLDILKRGYSIIEKDHIVIKSINDVNLNDLLTITLNDGIIKAKVEE
ncbi:MAG: exodeoxyribonuclease VII large subunit [Erysipelotrichaceae bacterium]